MRATHRPRLSRPSISTHVTSHAAPNTLVVHLTHATADASRNPTAALEEAVNLTQAIDLPVLQALIVRLRAVSPATYLGKGKVEEIAALIEHHAIGLVMVDAKLSPLQQRNLEKAWACKVIDRTALILEIFGARARTAEGKLQVELASLTYQKSRLVRSWTHLERQRGGFGFLGGPGESQIEIDRRLISDRIDKIKAQLANVVRTRELHRKQRRDIPYPLVALVGYTNAGKSTLFNRLTGSDVFAKNQLFATLDPTIRGLTLPSGTRIMLSDTVGFIANLPTELIAAFRATLEEVLEADLILHVRDVSAPDSAVQKSDVLHVLQGLFGKKDFSESMIEVHNKCDLLVEEGGHDNTSSCYRVPPTCNGDTMNKSSCPLNIALSALTGQGLPELCAAIDRALQHASLRDYYFTLPAAAGQAMAWLHAHGQVLEITADGDSLKHHVRLTESAAARFVQSFMGN